MSCVSRVIGVRARRATLPPVLSSVLLALLLVAPQTSAAPRSPVPTQRVRIEVLPPIAQMGALPADPSRAETVVTAAFRPHVRGRPVLLERKQDGAWVTARRSRQDAGGRVTFTAPRLVGGRAVAYRVIAAAYGRLPEKSSAPVRSTAWGSPAFVDTFDGAALGSAWQHRIQFYNPWGGRACSKGDPSAVVVAGGTLRLSVLADPARTSETCLPTDADGNPTSSDSYTWRLNGHVSTQHSFDFQYGVAAARMRFPQAQGQHGAFWLQPRGLLDDRPTPWGAEIDVIEYYGAQNGVRTRMSSTVHQHPAASPASTQTVGGPLTDPDRYLESRTDRWWRNFHVFSVEWTPREYVFRIDGQETLRTSRGVSHHPEFLILSLLSSDFELGRLGGDERLPQHADVDWVAAWPLPR
jgi:hypothetical protein